MAATLPPLVKRFFLFLDEGWFEQRPPSKVVGYIAGSIQIPCIAGDPKFNITWLHDDQVVNRDEPGVTILPSGSLELSNLTRSSFGRYTCRLTYQNTKTEADVNVEIKNGIIDYDNPKFQPNLKSDISAVSDSDLILPCHGQDRSPDTLKITIKWFKMASKKARLQIL